MSHPIENLLHFSRTQAELDQGLDEEHEIRDVTSYMIEMVGSKATT